MSTKRTDLFSWVSLRGTQVIHVYQKNHLVVVNVVAGDASEKCLPKDLICQSRSPARRSSAEHEGMSHTGNEC